MANQDHANDESKEDEEKGEIDADPVGVQDAGALESQNATDEMPREKVE